MVIDKNQNSVVALTCLQQIGNCVFHDLLLYLFKVTSLSAILGFDEQAQGGDAKISAIGAVAYFGQRLFINNIIKERAQDEPDNILHFALTGNRPTDWMLHLPRIIPAPTAERGFKATENDSYMILGENQLIDAARERVIYRAPEYRGTRCIKL